MSFNDRTHIPSIKSLRVMERRRPPPDAPFFAAIEPALKVGAACGECHLLLLLLFFPVPISWPNSVAGGYVWMAQVKDVT